MGTGDTKEGNSGGYSNNHSMGGNRNDRRDFNSMGTMSKSSSPQSDLDKNNDYHSDKPRQRDHSYQQDSMRQNDRGGYYKNQSMGHSMQSDPRMKNMDDYGYEQQDRTRTAPYGSMQSSRMSHHNNSMNTMSSGSMQQSFLHNPLANSGPSMKMKSMQMMNQDHHQMNDMNSMDMHQNNSNNNDSYLMNNMMQNNSMNDMMSMPGNDGNTGMSHLDQYILPQNNSPSIDTQVMNSNASYMSHTGGMQSVQIGNMIDPSESTMGGRISNQFSSLPSNSSMMGGMGIATTGMYGHSSSNNQAESLIDVCSSFRNLLPIPKNATNTVYVEGIPPDAKEREVARKSLYCVCLHHLTTFALPNAFYRHLPSVPWLQVR